MEKFKGTKGVWCYAVNSRYCEVRCINDSIYLSVNVMLYDKGVGSLTDISLSDDNKYNAKLISHAPELLDMLIDIKDYLGSDKREEIEQLITKATTI